MRQPSFSLFDQLPFPRITLPHSFLPLKKLSTLATLTLLLAACGGGGGSGNFDNLVNIANNNNVEEDTEETLRLGSGTGDNFSAGSINANQTDLEAGESTSLSFNVVNQNNEPPLSDFTLSINSPCIAGGLATVSEPALVTQGLYNAEYTAAGCSGTDTVTVNLVGLGISASVDLTVQPPEVLTVTFVEAEFPQLALAGIGGNESTEVTFRVTGPQGVAIIGEEVSFSINSAVGGARILAGRESGTTDNEGLVRTILNSGTTAGPVNVLAVHNATGKQGSSDDIIISTGVPIDSRFSVSYSPFNPPDAFRVDGVTVNVNFITSDQFGNNPLDGTRISFVAPESGNVEDFCEVSDGTCSITWRSTSPRPVDRRLEIIAYTDGAEDFIDNNGNSVYDAGDNFDPLLHDLGEPYADEDESGDYNVGEFFFDTNRNGVRDTGNGVWDGPCLSQVDASAVCEGEGTVSIFATVTVVMSTNSPRLLQLGTFGDFGTTHDIPQGATIFLGGLLLADSTTAADALGSNPMPLGTTVSFSIEGDGVELRGPTSFTVENTTSPTGFYGVSIAAAAVDPMDDLPPNATLLLTISPPSAAESVFSWFLNVIR